MKSPIRKLLVLANQSSSGSLIYFAYRYLDSQRSKHANKKQNARLNVRRYWFSWYWVSIFIFKINHVFMEGKDNPVEKVVIDEEEPDVIEIDGILNLQNPPKTVFIDQECWNLKVIVDGGELIRNINKKKPDILQAYKCPLCWHATGESIFSTSKWNILNQSGKDDFSCGQAADNFRGGKLFPKETNRSCLDLILGKRDRSCCSNENLRILSWQKSRDGVFRGVYTQCTLW